MHSCAVVSSIILNFLMKRPCVKLLMCIFRIVSTALVNEALQVFFKLRQIPGLKKPPSTSELIDWLSLLMADDMPEDILRNTDKSKSIPPLYGALIKNEQDVQLLERLAFMSRR